MSKIKTTYLKNIPNYSTSQWVSSYKIESNKQYVILGQRSEGNDVQVALMTVRGLLRRFNATELDVMLRQAQQTFSIDLEIYINRHTQRSALV